MRKKALLGTVLFSVSVWTSVGLANAAQQQQRQKRGLTLDDLKRICATHEDNEQIHRFTSDFTCSDTKTFWAKKGVLRLPLKNRSTVRFKGLIKEGAHESEWDTLPGHSEDQWTQCDVVEKWKATLHHTVTIKSCADLNKIETEHSFCAKELEAAWAECGREQADAMVHGFVVPKASLCTYEHTGITKQCDGGSPSPQQQCRQQQQGPARQQQQGQAQQQAQQQQQQDCVQEEVFVSDNELGADLKAETVDHGRGHRHHKAVLIRSDVRPGGMLAALGLQRGDVVSSIGGKRTHDLKEFYKYITRAKNSGKPFLVDYRDSTGKWLVVTRNF